MKCSIKNTALPYRGEPTRAAYKKPVINTATKHLRVIELPCEYNPRPAPIPNTRPKKKRKEHDSTAHCHERQNWTEDKIEQLISLYEKGIKCSEIGQIMNCSAKMVHVMISKLRKEGRVESLRCSIGWTEEQDQMLIELYNNGTIYEDIAEAVGKPISSAAYRIQRLRDVGKITKRRNKSWGKCH